MTNESKATKFKVLDSSISEINLDRIKTIIDFIMDFCYTHTIGVPIMNSLIIAKDKESFVAVGNDDTNADTIKKILANCKTFKRILANTSLAQLEDLHHEFEEMSICIKAYKS